MTSSTGTNLHGVLCSRKMLRGLIAAQCAQASALLAQDEFPTLGAPAVEALPNGGPYGHAPQGFANGHPAQPPSCGQGSLGQARLWGIIWQGR